MRNSNSKDVMTTNWWTTIGSKKILILQWDAREQNNKWAELTLFLDFS